MQHTVNSSSRQQQRRRRRSLSPQQRPQPPPQQRRSADHTPPLLPNRPNGSPALESHSVGAPVGDAAPSYGIPRGMGGFAEYDTAALRAQRIQVMQDVLRRTSLTELRDREIVEWLSETEVWLLRGEAAFASGPAVDRGVPLHGSSATGAAAPLTSSSATAAATSRKDSPCRPSSSGGGCGQPSGAPNYHFPGAAELRLLVLGVLHTMPWWRVVESIDTGTGVNSTDGPSPEKLARIEAGRRVPAALTLQTSAAAAKAVTRWHEKIQSGFERVCLVLVEQSQQTVPGVLEVVMKPFHLRPPVRDGAQRAIPTDTFLRIINAIATTYSAAYVLELFKTCLDSLLPQRRWPDRRHHLASTAMLLHLALDSVIPAFQPGTGNAHCLEHARDLALAADAVKAKAGGSHANPLANTANGVGAGGSNQEDDQNDDSVGSTREGADPQAKEAAVTAKDHTAYTESLASETDDQLAPLQLPVSTRQAQELQLQLPPSSDVDASDSNSSSVSSAAARSHGASRKHAFSAVGGKTGRSMGGVPISATATPRTMLVQMPSQLKATVSAAVAGPGGANWATRGQQQHSLARGTRAPQNNRMLAYRADVIRFLLRRLLDMELALEGDSVDDGGSLAGDDFSDTASRASTSFSGTASKPWWSPSRRVGGGAPRGITSPVPSDSTKAGPHPASLSSVSPSPHKLLSGGTNTQGPLSLSRFPSSYSAQVNQQTVAPTAKPFLHILADCTQLTFLMLAEDMRRQQGAGVCGNADWWREVVMHFLDAVRCVERPKCMLFLAPSLALLGDEDQPVDLLHKLVSLVTKGYMPSLGPSLPGPSTTPGGCVSGQGGGFLYGHTMTSASVSSQLRTLPPMVGGAGAAPVRMRMGQRPMSLAAQAVPMQERLRAAMFIFPLYVFMRGRISSIEGVRRRMMKWIAQELHRTGATAGRSSGTGATHGGTAQVRLPTGGSIAGQSSHTDSGKSGGAASVRLREVVAAQCAALSAAVVAAQATSAPEEREGPDGAKEATPDGSQQTLPRRGSPGLRPSEGGNPQQHTGVGGVASESSGVTTGGNAVGDSEINFVLHRFVCPAPGKSGEPNGVEAAPSAADGATQRGVAGTLALDLMEREGLLRPCLMDGCMWSAFLDSLVKHS